ncbi:hypothetical protein [Deinococcus aquiradiocola]|uniref:Uncharacterized protein n=1 Tax=Deinococcus aquiradiocola TaxID=393059 RepID=A0A917UPF8_9DEIO|nr:hypothetical protein [Deinococcus aquiradiocola]GGJ72470.1 hypothetical protein GCM10008939_16100 [Deinococcus aquiradiocola]
MNLELVRTLQASGDDAGALAALDALTPSPTERTQAAALALLLGRPRLSAAWADGEPLLHAAALLRLGERAEVLRVLAGERDSARVLVLRARATGDMQVAEQARAHARREGDSPALIAAAAHLGELLLPHGPYPALRALAEGLKVSEMQREHTDPYLLAVLSVVQAQAGGSGKAGRTAGKALERSVPRSPARVLALHALGQAGEAERERAAGDLHRTFSLLYPGGQV